MTTLEDLLKKYRENYNIVDIINLDNWYSYDQHERSEWLHEKIKKLYKPSFENKDRIIFTLTQEDEFENETQTAGLILTNLHRSLNQIDISNFFVVIFANESKITKSSQAYLQQHNQDQVPVTYEYFGEETNKPKKIRLKGINLGYNYNSVKPNKIDIKDLTEKQKKLLFENKNFCIYPWLHMHVEPGGGVYSCCGVKYKSESLLGKTTEKNLNQIWNAKPIRDLRLRMLNNESSAQCERCYEQEKAGFFSMRNSANKHHGHYINLVNNTKIDGTVDDFKMIYWDVRFNNLCNLKCRSCGPNFSSQWYQDQIKIAPDYSKNHKALIFAGKFQTDLWDQLIEHIDHVEQIYFAGGEPLLMEEHYLILDELEKRSKFNVRLIYNSNFTEIKLKDRIVFDYWKKFDSVSVGASLDAMGQRAEYIRKGTIWEVVENNRRLMIETCPKVDFYISATLSIMNALHLPDFHKDWANKGLIKPQDFNVNILTDPTHYRIDIAPENYKALIKQKYQEHLAWLSPKDSLRRASNGYESAINFMLSNDNTNLIEQFWKKTNQLDSIRNENILDVIPEIQFLK